MCRCDLQVLVGVVDKWIMSEDKNLLIGFQFSLVHNKNACISELWLELRKENSTFLRFWHVRVILNVGFYYETILDRNSSIWSEKYGPWLVLWPIAHFLWLRNLHLSSCSKDYCNSANILGRNCPGKMSLYVCRLPSAELCYTIFSIMLWLTPLATWEYTCKPVCYLIS